MFIKRQWALLAAVIWLAIVFIVQSQPVGDGDDKADELSIVSAAMNVKDELKASTESPKGDYEEELPKPKDVVDANHIQVIKMPSAEEAAEIIEELEEEIVKEKEVLEEIKTKEQDCKDDIQKIEEKVIAEAQPMLVLLETMTPKKPEEMTTKNDNEMMVVMKPAVSSERSPRSMQMSDDQLTSQEEGKASTQPQLQPESQPQVAAAASPSLTDEDIDKIMKMITFPQTDGVASIKTENYENTKKTEELVEIVEPRTQQTTEIESIAEKPRVGRSVRSTEGKGYYILAFSPIDDEEEGSMVTPTYTKFDIIPIEERSSNAGANVDDYADDQNDEDGDQQERAADSEEARLLTKKQFNKYMRKVLRQIRKGTRKVQRKTRLKSAKEEPTVENFVRHWYAASQKAKVASPKSSWFNWVGLKTQ